MASKLHSISSHAAPLQSPLLRSFSISISDSHTMRVFEYFLGSGIDAQRIVNIDTTVIYYYTNNYSLSANFALPEKLNFKLFQTEFLEIVQASIYDCIRLPRYVYLMNLLLVHTRVRVRPCLYVTHIQYPIFLVICNN